MANENKVKMSQERYDQLVAELEYLQTVREKEISEQIKEARSFGDLSENSEYDEAKTEQGKLYSKIAEYQVLLERAEIIEIVGGGTSIVLGSLVTVRDLEEDCEDQYRIVGSQEANPILGRISEDSPFGKALLGHVAGDSITVEAPAGVLQFEILNVEN